MSLRALYDLVAPAKINLFLHVVGRRADGYHLLESVFVPVSYTHLDVYKRQASCSQSGAHTQKTEGGFGA